MAASTHLHVLAAWFAPTAWAILWLALVASTIGLVILLRTRWASVNPWKKCALLSLWVHVLLACLAATIRINSGGGPGLGPGNPGPIRVAFLAPEPIDDKLTDDAPPKGDDPVPKAVEAPPEPKVEAKPQLESPPKVEEPQPEPAPKPADDKPALTAPDLLIPPKPAELKPESDASLPTKVDPKNVPTPASTGPQASSASAERAPAEQPVPTPTKTPGVLDGAHGGAGTRTGLPAAYAARFAANRDALVAGGGGNPTTERAVRAALAWLAAAQSPDGRWDAKRHGAGQERYVVLGQHRGTTGAQADTGMSGLALLAFLAAGHTHQDGPYAANMARGLDYLRKIQAADGNLAGNAEMFAHMYCHSMATFALSEAYAITRDEKLAPAVRAAVGYSLAVQHPTDGGWRYQAGQTGDTSQLGWQLMALKSAELGGVAVPPVTWTRVQHFLRNVNRGAHGGLAAYRPEGPPTRTMTAEALYCRQLLTGRADGGLEPAALDEAIRLLTAEAPQGESVNLYYWYYATLALHRSQAFNSETATAWRTWNDALSGTLVATQDRDGSWPTNCMWAGYGGRVYTTALAALNLEVYYRYSPEDVDATEKKANIARRPGWESVPSR